MTVHPRYLNFVQEIRFFEKGKETELRTDDSIGVWRAEFSPICYFLSFRQEYISPLGGVMYLRNTAQTGLGIFLM